MAATKAVFERRAISIAVFPRFNAGVTTVRLLRTLALSEDNPAAHQMSFDRPHPSAASVEPARKLARK